MLRAAQHQTEGFELQIHLEECLMAEDPAPSKLSDTVVDQQLARLTTIIEAVSPAGSLLQFTGVLTSAVLRLLRMNDLLNQKALEL